MNTVVYQSYRTSNVPVWITQCMTTVKTWAMQRGFDYVFIDDRLFDYVPDWYLEKINGNVLLASDLARLELAREFLHKGYARTIWVDADVVVFDPDHFNINVTEEFAFCLEVWTSELPNGEAHFTWGVNNAVTVFTQNNSMLDFYIYACKSYVQNKPGKISSLDVGTKFLTALYPNAYFRLLTNVGLFSGAVLLGIASEDGRYVEKYIRKFGYPIQAANLCSSQRDVYHHGIKLDDKMYQAVVDKLVQSRGSIINKYLQLSSDV